MKPMDFQEATAERILHIFRDEQQRRVVFSSWEMVPRVIAAMISYEAERLVVERLPETTRRKGLYPERKGLGQSDHHESL